MDKKQIFKEHFSQTKEKVVEEFKSHYNYYKHSDDSKEQSSQQKQKYLKLCEKFLEKLENAKLPKLTDDWWCYSYSLKNDSIDLVLSFCYKLEVENGELSSATTSEEFILLSVKCDYMTVAEYAKLYNVKEITVRQWIRRGKIRSAKKQGRDWIIPEIADKPKRGYEPVTYYWQHLTQEILEKFPFLKGYNNMYIFQNNQDKGLFDLILSSNTHERKEKIQVSNAKREKIELELISSNLVDVEEFKIFHA